MLLWCLQAICLEMQGADQGEAFEGPADSPNRKQIVLRPDKTGEKSGGKRGLNIWFRERTIVSTSNVVSCSCGRLTRPNPSENVRSAACQNPEHEEHSSFSSPFEHLQNRGDVIFQWWWSVWFPFKTTKKRAQIRVSPSVFETPPGRLAAPGQAEVGKANEGPFWAWFLEDDQTQKHHVAFCFVEVQAK